LNFAFSGVGQRDDTLFQTGIQRHFVSYESSLEEGIAPLSGMVKRAKST
jgi:hypothetical protein